MSKEKPKIFNKIKHFSNRTDSVYNVTVDGKNNKKVNILLSPMVVVLATYILLLISKLVDLTLLNRDNEYMSVIILQLMIFILPGALWVKFNGDKYVRRLRVKMISYDSILLIISASVVMSFGGLLLVVLFDGASSLSNNFILYNTFVSKQTGTAGNTLYLILAYAALPAICEEFIYRGILCCEYERGGILRAGIISSFFFALLHFDIRNFFVYFYCGAILCLVLYATRSLFTAMIAHFLYNVFGLFGMPYFGRLYLLSGNASFLVVISIIILLLFIFIFCMEASKLYRKYLREGFSSSYRNPIHKTKKEKINSYLVLLRDPYAIASVSVYIIAVIISLIF